MNSDRTKICDVISEMLDNPDNYGIYPTTKAYNALEEYIEGVRVQAVSWTYAHICTRLDADADNDPRVMLVPDLLANALKDLDS